MNTSFKEVYQFVLFEQKIHSSPLIFQKINYYCDYFLTFN
jgi:hypothetical protein